MKAVVLSFYHPELVKGGGQQVAINLHRAFLKSGVDSLFIGFDNNLPRTLRSEATPIAKLPGRRKEYLCQVASFNAEFMFSDSSWSSKAILDIVDFHKPDVVYVHHFMMIGIDLIYYLKKSHPATRFIFTAHEFLSVCMRDGHLMRSDGQPCSSQEPADCIGCFPSVPVANFTVRREGFRRFYSLFDCVVTPSKFMHQILVKSFPELKSRLVCIPNGSFYENEIKKIFKHRPDTGRNGVAFFGQMLSDKGILDLLKAIHDVNCQPADATLDFWGGNLELNAARYVDEFMTELKRYQHDDAKWRISLKGVFKNEESVALMARYKVLVFPSKWPETFSLVFSEAIISGAIVVVPKIGAFTERSKQYKDRAVAYESASLPGLSHAIEKGLRLANRPSSDQSREDMSIETMAISYLNLT